MNTLSSYTLFFIETFLGLNKINHMISQQWELPMKKVRSIGQGDEFWSG